MFVRETQHVVDFTELKFSPLFSFCPEIEASKLQKERGA